MHGWQSIPPADGDDVHDCWLDDDELAEHDEEVNDDVDVDGDGTGDETDDEANIGSLLYDVINLTNGVFEDTTDVLDGEFNDSLTLKLKFSLFWTRLGFMRLVVILVMMYLGAGWTDGAGADDGGGVVCTGWGLFSFLFGVLLIDDACSFCCSLLFILFRSVFDLFVFSKFSLIISLLLLVSILFSSTKPFCSLLDFSVLRTLLS